MIRLPLAAALALLSGASLLLAFPPYGVWALAPAGVALLALAVRGRRLRAGAGLGLIAGIVFFGPLLSWTNMHVGYAPWVLLTLFQATYFALLGMALAWVTPLAVRKPWSWPLLIGLLWVAQEALRDRAPFGGFPWGRLAFSQGDSPALNLASLGGAPLVTFAVALAGGLLATAAWAFTGGLRATAAAPRTPHYDSPDFGEIRLSAEEDRRISPKSGESSVGVAWAGESRVGGSRVAAAWVVGAWVAGAVAVMGVGAVVPVSIPDGQAVTVAVVQGNVPRLGLDFNEQRQAVLNNHVRATLELAAKVKAGQVKQPDLVVWPENASDIDPLLNPEARAAIDQAALAINAPILVGAVLHGPGDNESRNAGIVWLPGTGPGQMYLKRHPVPFAEYLPMRPIVEPIARAITNQAKLLRTDFVSGTVPGVLDLGPAKVGDVICFEVAYDDVVRDVVESGATLLAVQTNNATFDEAEASQQLAMVRLRAVEHGRDALMASTVGISAFVTADGAIHDASEFNTAAVMVRELHIGASTTLATRLGALPEFALALLAALALVAATVVRRRREQ